MPWASFNPGPVFKGQDDQTTYRAIIPGEVSRLNEQLWGHTPGPFSCGSSKGCEMRRKERRWRLNVGFA